MRMKYLLIGLFAGMLLATAGTSFAESVTEKVTAYLRPDFQMDIDGQQVKLENAPLIYNDASYLPVRELSSILGKDVDFQNDTILLTSKEDESMDGWISIRDLAKELGLKLTADDNGDQIVFTEDGSIKITFPIPEIDGPEVIGQTEDGNEIRVKRIGYNTCFSVEDLETIGIYNQ